MPENASKIKIEKIQDKRSIYRNLDNLKALVSDAECFEDINVLIRNHVYHCSTYGLEEQAYCVLTMLQVLPCEWRSQLLYEYTNIISRLDADVPITIAYVL